MLGKLRDRAQASMNDHLASGQSPTVFPKRESPQDMLHLKHEDELTTLGGKTRLVSPKSAGTSSSRGSRSPPAQSPLMVFSSPPPQTPTSPTAAPQSQGAYYADPYIQQTFGSAEAYPSSPEFSLLGHGNGQIQGHGSGHNIPQLQQAHTQTHAYAHAHAQWQADPSLAMGYGVPMDTSATLSQMPTTSAGVAHSQQQVRSSNGIENMLGMSGHGLSSQGQYGLNGGYYSTMPDYQNTYAPQQNYLPSPSDIVSPQEVDLSGAWGNFMTQYVATEL